MRRAVYSSDIRYRRQNATRQAPADAVVCDGTGAHHDNHSLPALLQPACRINLAASGRHVTFATRGIRTRVRASIGRFASYPADAGTQALSVGRLIGAVSVRTAALDDAPVGIAPLIVGTLRRFSTARAAIQSREPPILIFGTDQPVLAIRVLLATRAFSLGSRTAAWEQQGRKNVCHPKSESRHALKNANPGPPR